MAFILAPLALVLVERRLLAPNPVAIVRRLLFVTFLGNLVWLLVLALSFLIGTLASDPLALLGAYSLGMLVAIAFRVFVFQATFTGNPARAAIIAAVQPVVLGLPAFPASEVTTLWISQPWTWSAGVGVIFLVAAYLWSVERAGASLFAGSPLALTRAFLQAWAAHDPGALEALVERSSTPMRVSTHVVMIEGEQSKAAIILPEVHPGPFFPVGSYNLPGDLGAWFGQRGYIPLVLHSVSGHELNLPSRSEVLRYLGALDSMQALASAPGATPVLSHTSGRATAHGLRFGHTAVLVLSFAPSGADDFPPEVLATVQERSKAHGLETVFVIDAHNALGPGPNRADCDAALQAADEVMARLAKTAEGPIFAGFAHSRDLALAFEPDVGPGGIAVGLLANDGQRWALVALDGNNAVPTLQEEIRRSLEGAGFRLLEVCTSDTHVSAGQAPNTKGYHAVGELTQPRVLAEAVQQIALAAQRRVGRAHLRYQVAEADVRVVGRGALRAFAHGLDFVLPAAYRRAFLVVAAALALVLVASWL